MKVSLLAQRDINQARVDKIAADLDIEQLGTPTVSERGEWFYIVDGQHRVEALRQIGYGDQNVQCWAYAGLTEESEAEMFLKLNNVLAIHAFDKFRIGVHANRGMETDIDRIVRSQDLRVTRDVLPGAVQAVGSLQRIYKRSGPKALARTLRLAADAYGDTGLGRDVLNGLGYVVGRYNGELDDTEMTNRLATTRGGVNGLLTRAEKLRHQTGLSKGECVAAAAVDIYNAKGGKKLTSWFKTGA